LVWVAHQSKETLEVRVMTRVRTGWMLLMVVGLGVLLLFPLTSPSYVRALTPTFTPTPTPVATRSVTDDEVNAIAKKLYCPVCENIPLDTCGTQACEDWRQLIREFLEQGWTEEQILNYFVERYGERVLATPRPRGPHVLVYVLPPVFVVAGVFLLFRTLKAWRTAAPDEEEGVLATDSPATSEEDPYRKQLEEELRKRL